MIRDHTYIMSAYFWTRSLSFLLLLKLSLIHTPFYFIGYILEKDLFHVINAKRDFITKEQLNSHKFWGQFLVTISGQLCGLFVIILLLFSFSGYILENDHSHVINAKRDLLQKTISILINYIVMLELFMKKIIYVQSVGSPLSKLTI